MCHSQEQIKSAAIQVPTESGTVSGRRKWMIVSTGPWNRGMEESGVCGSHRCFSAWSMAREWGRAGKNGREGQKPDPEGNKAAMPFLTVLVVRTNIWTSLVVQWLGVHLPTQGTWVWSLIWEDPTWHGAAKPEHHDYWARAREAAAIRSLCITTRR